MEKLFIGWITLQLMVVGVANVSIHNQIVKKIYVCDTYTKTFPVFLAAVLPLAIFIPENTVAKDYCSYQEELTDSK